MLSDLQITAKVKEGEAGTGMHDPPEPGRRGDGAWGHPSYTAIELGGGWGDQHNPNPYLVFWSLMLSLRAPRQPLAPCFDLNSCWKFSPLLPTSAQGAYTGDALDGR